MKKVSFLFLFAALAATGCQSPSEKKSETSTTVIAPPSPPPAPSVPDVPKMDTAIESKPTKSGGSTAACYQLIDKDKTAHVCQIETRATPNPFAGGYMDYAPYQKDGGHGVLRNGVIEKGMLTADWVYMIEGSVQVEEVYMKMDGDKLTKMRGELVDKKGKMVAKDKTKLKAEYTLAKVDCAKIKATIDGIKSMEKNLVMPAK